MIPLLRPDMPEPASWLPYLEESRKANQWSNEGPNVLRAKETLSGTLKRFVLPCSNGTTAVQLALQATLPRGSRVALPSFTFIATLNAVISAGMSPVLFPASRETWTIDPSLLWAHREKFDAFIAVQPFGYRLNFELYDELAYDMGRKVIYDCAAGFDFQSHTTNAVCYSLHATKNLPIGEGGLVSFDRESDYFAARSLSNFHFGDDRRPHSIYGGNMKMDEVHAAILRAQLNRRETIEARIEARKWLVDEYQTDLADFIEPCHLHRQGAPQVCMIVTRFADKIAEEAPRLGVMVRRYYHPILSSLKIPDSVQIVGESPKHFEKFLALPSDLIEGEYSAVIDVLRSICR